MGGRLEVRMWTLDKGDDVIVNNSQFVTTEMLFEVS